jgi:hypothetical protein
MGGMRDAGPGVAPQPIESATRLGAATVVCAGLALLATVAVVIFRSSLWWTLVPAAIGLVGFVLGVLALPRIGRAGGHLVAATIGLVLCALAFSGWAVLLVLIWTIGKGLSLSHWDF